MDRAKSNVFFDCPICGRLIKNKKANLRRHMQLHQQKHHRAECDFCEKDFQTKSNLKRHIQEAHDVNEIEEVKLVEKCAKSKFVKLCAYLFFESHK